MKRRLLTALIAMATVLTGATTASADMGEWRQAGANAFRTSRIRDYFIDPTTVGQMVKAWVYRPEIGSFGGQAITPSPVMLCCSAWRMHLQARRCADALCSALEISPILTLHPATGALRADAPTQPTLPTDEFSSLAVRTLGLYAIDGDGSIITRWDGGQWRFGPEACTGGTLMMQSRTVIAANEGTICAVDGWTGLTLRITPATSVPDAAAPAVTKRRLPSPAHRVIVFGSPHGLARAYNLDSGELLWENDAATSDYPMIAGRSNVAFTGETDISVYGLLTGRLRYRVEPNEGETMLLPAHGYGSMYTVATDGVVRAITSATGTTVWTTDLPGGIDTSKGAAGPVVAGGVVFVATNSPTPTITALDYATGAVLHTFQMEGDGIVSMLIWKGHLYAVGRDRVVAWVAPGAKGFPV